MIALRVDANTPEPAAIARAADVIRGGGVVAYPTDTLYGLAVDPRNDDAVARLFSLKGRDAAQAIPLIAASTEQAQQAGRLEASHVRLADAFWPGPLSIVVAAEASVSRLLLAGGSTVAIRVPAHGVARRLAEAFGYCITATSANLSGAAPATTPDAVAAALGDRIDAIVDAGPSPGGLPSTLVAIDADGPVLLRAGAIPWDRVLRSFE